jgi:hypothetical protein
MPRFTANLTGTAPNEVLTVVDTGVTPNKTVLQTTLNLHQAGGGGSGALASRQVVLREVDRTFPTPYGSETEMGFDLDFILSASGGAKEVGRMCLAGFKTGTPIDRLDTYTLGTFFQRTTAAGYNQNLYPGDMYSPVVVFRNASYNFCAALCYPLLEYDHEMHIEGALTQPSGTSDPADAVFRVQFNAARSNSLNPWFTIPDGQTRVYTIRFRINPRTNTNIGSGTNPASEWLWTLRGYQRYFRSRFGKPDYRRMGGWNGRVMASLNASVGTPYDATTNPRWFQPRCRPRSRVGNGIRTVRRSGPCQAAAQHQPHPHLVPLRLASASVQRHS